MGRKIIISVGALVVLGMVAGVFIWMRARGVQPPRPDTVSPEPSEFHEASAASLPPVAHDEKPAPSIKNKKTTPPVTELPLKTGEVLNYTANVSKLDNVATLTLKVAGKGNRSEEHTSELQS